MHMGMVLHISLYILDNLHFAVQHPMLNDINSHMLKNNMLKMVLCISYCLLYNNFYFCNL